MDLEKVISSILESNNELKQKGTVLVNKEGKLCGIVPKYDIEENSEVSGIIEYSFSEGEKVLEIAYIQNKAFHGCTKLAEYISEEARREGMKTMLSCVEHIAKGVNANKITMKTWILAARPNLLTKNGCFFYGWTPENINDHIRAAKMLKYTMRLRDKKVATPLVRYYKNIKESKDDFDIDAYIISMFG